MSSKSFAEPLALWFGTRMPAGRFAALTTLVVVAAAMAGTVHVGWVAPACIIALLLIFQFRLWDDLADAPRDRLDHPERVLPRCASDTVFPTAICLSAGINLIAILMLSGVLAGMLLLLLNIVFAAWYRRGISKRIGFAGAHFVLLKYPAFVVLLAPRPVDATSLALACAAVYFALGAYEMIHDPRHRREHAAIRLIAAELAVLVIACALLALHLFDRSIV